MKDNTDIFSTIKELEKQVVTVPKKLPILPLRDMIIFPYMIFPVLIGRAFSLKSVAKALEQDKFIFVSAQKDSSVEDPGIRDLYRQGTVAKIIQILRLPNNLLKILVEGLYPATIKKSMRSKDLLEAEIQVINLEAQEDNQELSAVIRQCTDLFAEYIKSNHALPPDILSAFDNINDPIRKLYYIAANVQQKIEVKQKILEKKTLIEQYFELATIITSELEIMKLENEISNKVHDNIQKTQRKYYIQEQIRALQNELGEDEELSPELITIKEKLDKADFPESVKTKINEEYERLKKTPTMSPEFSVNRNYLELLASLPWKERTEDNMNIEHVKQILDEDHYDLEKPKERILEYIAVLNLVGALKRQILCFVGPPGVGKTSLGRSIARALGRKFSRFSLGGVRDEAEIRGHRRTYIGALPGKIIQSMKKAGTVNPVILLDEIDKMSMDFRGDPSSALLEVLDPEQNVAFNDHYLEVDYDLSDVLFITTANVKYDIPLPLQDRMEIIELSSYLEMDKMEIARLHIIPRLFKELGLSEINIEFKNEAIMKIIREYTREAGVRSLEREIASILRKLAKEIVEKHYSKQKEKMQAEKQSNLKKALIEDETFKKSIKRQKHTIDEKSIEKYLKAPRFKQKKDELNDKVGAATGLAWTSVGGDTLPIEVTIMPGPEKLTLTGKLGDVMKESAHAALSYLRSNTKELGVPDNFYRKKEIHIHIPEGAIPKDGPSAGITMATALISAASGRSVRGDIAMTGEITLRGNILAIGGLNEKLLAAKRAGIKDVIIPQENERDIEDIKEEIKSGLNIIPVSHISEAVEIAINKSN
ncbi:MAG: endopeptidase La [Ignavibacteria bacterium]|jgi:ATP-dependent Lon protease|nr:endopeptidase La [Ignavibacteria bacterium]